MTSEPVFGPDGTVYLIAGNADGEHAGQKALVALSGSGQVKPGWPVEASLGYEFGPPAVDSEAAVYVEECGEPRAGCALHRFGTDGMELPGWPFQIPQAATCPLGDPCVSRLVVGTGGVTYLVNWHQARAQTQLIAIDAAGEIVPGWPVALDDSYGWWMQPQLASDGTLLIDTVPGTDVSPVSLLALTADGSTRSGWPLVVPGFGGFQPGPGGTFVIVSYEPLLDPSEGGLCSDASRTVFAVVDPIGRTLPGWPRGSKGYATAPVVDADGTLYYISALGNVYAHDRTGEMRAGWPVPVSGVFPGCGAGGLYRGSDGTIYVLSEEVVALFPDGTGWRYRPDDGLSWPCFDADCVPVAVAPAFGPDGSIYVVAPRSGSADVIALDRQGKVKLGWPYRLFIDPNDPTDPQVTSLTVSPDGRLYVVQGNTVLALDADGRVSQ
jgi:hypothetical protein